MQRRGGEAQRPGAPPGLEVYQREPRPHLGRRQLAGRGGVRAVVGRVRQDEDVDAGALVVAQYAIEILVAGVEARRERRLLTLALLQELEVAAELLAIAVLGQDLAREIPALSRVHLAELARLQPRVLLLDGEEGRRGYQLAGRDRIRVAGSDPPGRDMVVIEIGGRETLGAPEPDPVRVAGGALARQHRARVAEVNAPVVAAAA